MKIAILSDIHDNIWNLRAALAALQDADALICCGDLCSPFVVTILAENYTGPIHMVYGNNDGDLLRISNNARRFSHFHIEGELFQAEFGGKRFAVNHYDNIAIEIARSGSFDVVCFGHNHRIQIEMIRQTLAINPGTLMGYSPLDQKEVPPTFVVYDTDDNHIDQLQVALPADHSQLFAVTPYNG